MRPRLLAAVLAASTIAAGLAARALLGGAPAKVLGVALWATLVYFLILAVRPTVRIANASLLAAAISFAVEFFQLTPIPRALAAIHPAFALVFGTTFHGPDLPSYLAGVLFAALLHAALKKSLTGGLPDS